MKFRIPCETYTRLMPITQLDSDKHEPYFKCMYVERSKGLTVAIATNRRVMAVEKIPDADEDGSAFLVFNEALMQQAKTEAAMAGYIDCVANDVLQFTSAKTMFGFTVPGNAGMYPQAHIVNHWRDWIGKAVPTESGKGGMMWYYPNIAALGASSPSGRVRFPQHIDCAKPVFIRDMLDDKWLGIFMPNYIDDDKKPKLAEAATLPGWLA